jgi:flagellar biosynthesis protein FlhF
MDAKRFIGVDSRAAFAQVRKALGRDAVILSSRKVEDGIEVTAGSGEEVPVEDVAVMERPAKPRESKPAKSAVELTSLDYDPPPSTRKPQSSTTSGAGTARSANLLKAEFASLKRSLLAELSAVKIVNWQRDDSVQFRVLKNLIEHGFGVGWSASVLAAQRPDADYEQMCNDAFSDIEASLQAIAGSPISSGNNIVLMHGLSGSGKTTALAKLAAKSVSEYGADDTVIVCADSHRMGGYQQLQGFGRILNVPVLQVRKPQELDEILHALSGKRLVLVDQSSFTLPELDAIDELDAVEHLPGFRSSLDNVQHLLVLAANTQSLTVDKILASKLARHMAGVALTKTDESAQLGEVLTSLIEHDMKVCYVSDGRDLQHDIKRFSAERLMEQIIQLGKKPELTEEAKQKIHLLASLNQHLDFIE